MDAASQFDKAINLIDVANREDPRTELVDGQPQPREFLFSQRVYKWVLDLANDPSEELLLAARCHTLGRWAIPRDKYPMTTTAYHQWRDALALHHADEAETVLRSAGYGDEMVAKVRAFISKENWPQSAEACTLEDADCLVFLETKLKDYTDDWDEAKTVNILLRTLRKMTPKARAAGLKLTLGEKEAKLVGEAVRQFQEESNAK